jgi:lipopolysaccharide transport system permease protein
LVTAESIIESESRAAVGSPEEELVELVIDPPRGWGGIEWSELWRYRELLYFLAWRDTKVRYKQTVLGGAWAILQPLVTALVFTVFFGRLAGLESRTGGVPYYLFALAGILPWTFFASALTSSSNSLLGNTQLITKVYFPRLLIPFAAVAAASVDLLVALAALVLLVLVQGTTLSAGVLALPLLIMGTALAATGAGTLLAAVTVTYRDLRHVVTFLIQIWMFASPVVYPSTIVPQQWRWAFALNPMAGLIDGFRGSLLYGSVPWGYVGISLFSALLLFIVGTVVFRRAEEEFADVI